MSRRLRDRRPASAVPEELNTPTARLDLSGLAEAEHAQIRYRRPHTLGDLPFNRWD